MAPPVVLQATTASVRVPTLARPLASTVTAQPVVAPKGPASISTASACKPARLPEAPLSEESVCSALVSTSWSPSESTCPEASTPQGACRTGYLAEQRSLCGGAASSVSSFSLHKDQNSVTIKSDTMVKDAAGAIVKVLDRLCSTMVTALQQDASHEAVNRAVKALAVCRKYLTDTQPGMELSFQPVNRSDSWGREDPHLFSFLAFKSMLKPGVELNRSDETDLHVSSNSDAVTMANTIVRSVLEKGQVVMKAGGSCALFVAMSAIIRARQMLKAMHSMDILLVPQWITEDTRASLGRESKFLQFSVLPSGMHGVLPGAPQAPWQPAIVPITAQPAE